MKCILCNGDVCLRVFRNSTDLIKCRRCGFVYVVKFPKQEEKKIVYDNADYYTHLIDAQKDDVEHNRFAWKGYLDFLGKEIKNKGRLLDMGCGTGFFLNWAKKRDWQVWGLDPSSFACQCALENYGLNIFNCELEEMRFSDQFFDAITAWSVVEHVDDPLKLLLEVNRILKKRGFLGLSVPNINSWEAKIFKERWGNLGKGHLYYFDLKTIKLLLKKTGFVPVKITTIGGLGIRTHLSKEKIKLKNSGSNFLEIGNNLVKRVLALFKKGGILVIWAIKP